MGQVHSELDVHEIQIRPIKEEKEFQVGFVWPRARRVSSLYIHVCRAKFTEVVFLGLGSRRTLEQNWRLQGFFNIFFSSVSLCFFVFLLLRRRMGLEFGSLAYWKQCHRDECSFPKSTSQPFHPNSLWLSFLLAGFSVEVDIYIYIFLFLFHTCFWCIEW